jgi:hypothetical protein
MGVVVRFFAACKDGVVVASCASVRNYQYAVLHSGLHGIVVSWHTTHAGAQRALELNRASLPNKEIIAAIETTERYAAGYRFHVARVSDAGTTLSGVAQREVAALERIYAL